MEFISFEEVLIIYKTFIYNKIAFWKLKELLLTIN